MIVHDHASVAVQNTAAGRRDRHRFDAVLQRQFVEMFRILHLQPPEAGDQDQKDGDRGILKDGDFRRGKPRIVIAQRCLLVSAVFEIGVDWGNDHKTRRRGRPGLYFISYRAPFAPFLASPYPHSSIRGISGDDPGVTKVIRNGGRTATGREINSSGSRERTRKSTGFPAATTWPAK